jgi:cholinesterase
MNGTANAGLLDQPFALEWIQSYIPRFGGDPNRVTIMGESAGGASITHQITAYGGMQANVPFQQAILQSAAWLPCRVALNRKAYSRAS